METAGEQNLLETCSEYQNGQYNMCDQEYLVCCVADAIKRGYQQQ